MSGAAPVEKPAAAGPTERATAGDWVRRSVGAVGLARGAEALAVGLGSGLCLWAICIWEGTGGPARLAAAGVGTLCAAAGWWLAHRPRAAELARRIDRATDQDGQFVTAYQREERLGGAVAPSPVALLLAQRALQGLRWREIRAAVLPPSLACAAAPFAGAAILAAALQTQRDAELGGIAALDLGGDVVEELVQARNAAYASGELSDEATQQVDDLVQEAKEVFGAGTGEAAPAGLAALRERLEEVALQVQAEPAVDLHLERAAGGLDVLGAEDAGLDLSARAGGQDAADPSDPPGPANPGGPPASESPAGQAPAAGGGQQAARAPQGAEGSGGSESKVAAGQAREGQGQDGPDGGSGSSDPSEAPPPDGEGAAVGSRSAGLDWLDSLAPERRDLALRWLERREGGQ